MFSSFTHLKSTLTEGWQIEPPVYVRARRRSADAPENVYHFILWNGNKVNLVSVRDCSELQQFLDTSKLSIDHI